MNRSLGWVLVLSLLSLPLTPRHACAGGVADAIGSAAKSVGDAFVSAGQTVQKWGDSLSSGKYGGGFISDIGTAISHAGGAIVHGAGVAVETVGHWLGGQDPAQPAGPSTPSPSGTSKTTTSGPSGWRPYANPGAQTTGGPVSPVSGPAAPSVPAPAVPAPTAGPVTATGPGGKVQRVIETNAGPSGTGGASGNDDTLKQQTDDSSRWGGSGGGNTDFFGPTGRKEEFVQGGGPGNKGLSIPGFYAGTACGSSNVAGCGRHDKAVTGYGSSSMGEMGLGGRGGGGGSASAEAYAGRPPLTGREQTFEGSADDRFISQQVGAIPQSKGLGDVKELRTSTPLSPEEAERNAAGLLASAKDKLNSKDFEGAYLELSEALKLQPQNPTLWMYRSMANNLRGKYAEAEADARKAIELDPQNEQAWENLAWALLKQGKYQEAIEAAKEVLKINPKNGMAYAISAFAKEKLGDKAGSLADIKKAASLDKRFSSFYQKAARGQPIYDPNLVADFMLAEEPIPNEQGSGALIAGLLLLLAALGGGFYYLKKNGKLEALGALFKKKPAGPKVIKI